MCFNTFAGHPRYTCGAMLNIYKKFWQVNWAEQWQYRGNLLMYLAFWMVSPIVFLAVWGSIARAQGSVGGYTAADFAAYYLTALLVDVLTSSISIHLLAYKIQDGTIANELLRPVHPVIDQRAGQQHRLQGPDADPVSAAVVDPACALSAGHDHHPGQPAAVLPALVGGFLVHFLFDSAITLLAFWTTRVYALHDMVMYALATILSGKFVPLTLLPAGLRAAADVLPFRLTVAFPVQLMLNQLSPAEIAGGFALQALWIALFFIAFRFIWSRALTRFSAVGA